jgi:hypothetical protein
MFIVNEAGRIVDLPHRLEESGFRQAREVLSISQELMDGVPTGVTMSDWDAQRLRDSILKRYPDVVTDDVYMEESGWTRKLEENIPKKDSELVNIDMTINEVIKIANENGIILDSKEERFVKDKLIELVNERHIR